MPHSIGEGCVNTPTGEISRRRLEGTVCSTITTNTGNDISLTTLYSACSPPHRDDARDTTHIRLLYPSRCEAKMLCEGYRRINP